MLIFLPLLSMIAQADNAQAIEQLTRSYQLELPLDANQVNICIDNLKTVLAGCEETQLAARLEYRIGVLYFKTQQFAKAQTCFERLLLRPSLTRTLRGAALNMLVQSYRLQGDDRAALTTLAKLINVSKENPHLTPALSQLRVFAHWTRAEIFLSQQNCTQARQEYQQLLSLPQIDSELLPQILAHCAEINFRSGEFKQYLERTEQITRDYPDYLRLPLIRFRAECVRFCQANDLPIDSSQGSAQIAVQIIAAIKNNETPIEPGPLLQILTNLTQEYAQNPWSRLLIYHQGWLLDAQGSSRAAAVAFARHATDPIPEQVSDGPHNKTVATLQNYAGLQQAIILSEQAQYAQAANILDTLRNVPPQSHIAQMKKAVEKNIAILKRETHPHEIAP